MSKFYVGFIAGAVAMWMAPSPPQIFAQTAEPLPQPQPLPQENQAKRPSPNLSAPATFVIYLLSPDDVVKLNGQVLPNPQSRVGFQTPPIDQVSHYDIEVFRKKSVPGTHDRYIHGRFSVWPGKRTGVSVLWTDSTIVSEKQ